MLSEHLLRRSEAGVGFENAALKGRNLAKTEEWKGFGHDSKHIQVFSWNAGNLQRHSSLDAVNDILASPFHIACIQEAAAYCVQPQLFDSRGITSVSSRDRSTMINAGGTGLKIVRKHIRRMNLSAIGFAGPITMMWTHLPSSIEKWRDWKWLKDEIVNDRLRYQVRVEVDLI